MLVVMATTNHNLAKCQRFEKLAKLQCQTSFEIQVILFLKHTPECMFFFARERSCKINAGVYVQLDVKEPCRAGYVLRNAI